MGRGLLINYGESHSSKWALWPSNILKGGCLTCKISGLTPDFQSQNLHCQPPPPSHPQIPIEEGYKQTWGSGIVSNHVSGDVGVAGPCSGYSLSSQPAEDTNLGGSISPCTEWDFSVALWKGGLLSPFLCMGGLSRIPSLFHLREGEIQRPPTKPMQLCVYGYLVAEQRGALLRYIVRVHLWRTRILSCWDSHAGQWAASVTTACAGVAQAGALPAPSFPPCPWDRPFFWKNSLTYSNTFHWWQL